MIMDKRMCDEDKGFDPEQFVNLPECTIVDMVGSAARPFTEAERLLPGKLPVMLP